MTELNVLLPQGFGIIAGLLAGIGVPEPAVLVLRLLLVAGIVLAFIMVNSLVLVYLERKISARMQSRLGPMRVGPHGILQTVADAIKLFLKGDSTPDKADKWMHRLAPALAIIPAILCFAAVPFGAGLIPADLDIGLIFVLAVSSVAVVGIVLAGWSSNNKYTLIGAMRSGAQLVSYEIPRALALLPPVIFAQSLQWSQIMKAQEGYRWFVWQWFPAGVLSFLIYLAASVAETNRTPFDLPEAESELVAGFNTEYSGMKFAFFFMAEFTFVLMACMVATAAFFGGGEAPLPFLKIIPSWIWFLAKTYTGVFVFMWFRWTFPRLRVDRLMAFNWKFLIPWSFAALFIAAAWAVLWK